MRFSPSPLSGRSSAAVSAALVLSALAASASAEFRVVTPEATTSRAVNDSASVSPWSMTVEFNANPQRSRASEIPRFPYTMSVEDEMTGEIRVVEGNRPESDPLAERTLILTPTLLTAEELSARVEVLDWIDGTVAGGADATDAVTVRPFAIGTALQGIEIIARPGRVRDADGETRTAGRIRIDLDGPAHAAGRADITPRAMNDPLVQRILSTSVLNTEAARTTRSQVDSSNTFPLPAMPTAPGDFRLTYENGDEILHLFLEDLGIFDPASAEYLALNYHGDLLPWITHPDGGVLFYAPRSVTEADENDSVFAGLDPVNGGAGPMRTRQAFTTLAPPANPAQATERGIQRSATKRITNVHRQYVVAAPIGQRIFSDRLDRTSNNTYQANIPIWDIPTNGFAIVRATVVGDAVNATYSPDHIGGISVNGSVFAYFDWDGFTKVTRPTNWTGVLPVGFPVESVPITYQVPTTAPPGYAPFNSFSDPQYLESLEIVYLGKPRVGPNFSTTVFVVAGNQGRISVGGFPAGTPASQIVVLDVTNPKDPEHLLNPVVFPDETGGTAVHFQSPVASRTYHIQWLSATNMPYEIATAESLPDTSNLTVPLRAIYVRQPEYASALAPLVQHRGVGVIEIDQQAAYNTFSGGQKSLEALREALQLIIERAPEKVPFPSVMLVGHGILDQRNLTGLKVHPQIPGNVVPSTPIASLNGPDGFRIGENLSDYAYATLFGEDYYPDVRLSRIAVRNSADVTRFVNRLLKHEEIFSTAPASPRPLVFAAGKGNAGEDTDIFWNVHHGFAEPLWASTPYSKVSLKYDFASPGTNNFNLLRNAIQGGSGSSFILYLGHGNEVLWDNPNSYLRAGGLASVFHAAYIDSRNKWPIAINFTCLSGRFSEVGRNEIDRITLAETLLHYINPDFGVAGGILPDERRDDRGAVAAIMPVGVDYLEPLVLLELEFLEQMAGQNTDGLHRPLVLGDEWIGAQIAYIDDIVSVIPDYARTLEEFILFGDPDTLTTLVSPLAEYKVGLKSLPTFANLGDQITIRVIVEAEDIGDEARGLVATIALPPELEYYSATPPVGTISESNGIIEWTLGSLLPGVQIALDIQVGVLPEAIFPLEVTSTVTAWTDDFDPTNNTATVIITTPPDVTDSFGIF